MNDHSAVDPSMIGAFSMQRTLPEPPLPKQEEPVAWHPADELPAVSKGDEDQFILAVRNDSTGKVHTFAAHYLNAYRLEVDDACGNCDEACETGDGCPYTGWHTLVGDERYDSGCYHRLQVREGRTFLGWRELPEWNTRPSLDARMREALEEIKGIFFTGAPIDTEATQYYAFMAQRMAEIADAALSSPVQSGKMDQTSIATKLATDATAASGTELGGEG